MARRCAHASVVAGGCLVVASEQQPRSGCEHTRTSGASFDIWQRARHSPVAGDAAVAEHQRQHGRHQKPEEAPAGVDEHVERGRGLGSGER